MKKNNIHLKSIFSLLLLWNLFSIAFAATTQKWREIVDLLKDDWRTEPEIRQAITDLWYNANEYLWVNTNSNIKVITNTSSNTNSSTSSVWRNIINNLRKDWRTDEEIKESIRELWYDPSAYFPSNNTSYSTQYPSTTNSSASVYTSRSCKPYTIEYISSINAYTSPDLKRKEYFVNIEYFKRYVDSKNVWNAECTQNNNRISTSYTDNSWSPDRFTAPNGKIYFIVSNNWQYTSNELSKAKNFSTINELKDYIRARNPLIYMWAQPSQIQPSKADTLFQTLHWAATEEISIVPNDENISTGSIETLASSNENTNNENKQTESSIEKEKDANVISSLRGQLFN